MSNENATIATSLEEIDRLREKLDIALLAKNDVGAKQLLKEIFELAEALDEMNIPKRCNVQTP